MKLVPRSLAGRLLLAAGAAIAIALLLAGLLIDRELERFVVRQVDGRLDAQIALIDAALDRGDGAFEDARSGLDRPPFDRREKWRWIVLQGDRPLTASSPFEPTLFDDPPRGPGGPIRPVDLRGEDGRLVHWRVLRKGNGETLIAAGAPFDTAIAEPRSQTMRPLFVALVVLGLALAAAAVVQVRLGLRPLHALRDELSDIRAGKRQNVDETQPAEIQPLAVELNKLLRDNAEGLARARRHAANLAHGLKTPLATLSTGPWASREPEVQELVERMDRLIRHHLTRARAAALGEPARARTNARERLADLAQVMRTVHGARAVEFVSDVSADATVACETQDFDEIFGNLLDNAFKWARGRVQLAAKRENRRIVFAIEDDGPGIRDEAVHEVLEPGRRADETMPGYGFGLPIAVELVELYGGTIELDASPTLNGARVRVRLPAALD